MIVRVILDIVLFVMKDMFGKMELVIIVLLQFKIVFHVVLLVCPYFPDK